MSGTTPARVDGHTIELSNLDKVLYPEVGFTKGQVVDYYSRVAPAILPHLKDHPLTMKRYPDGVEGEYFYEKECPFFHPDWVDTATMESRNVRGSVNFCVLNGPAPLVWVANLASLELHVLLSKRQDLGRPTAVAFDLDPGEGSDIMTACRAALKLKDLLEEMGLRSFAKCSGGKGMHVYVPLNTKTDFVATKAFAHAVASMMEKREPDLVTSNMRKDLRKGKILVDWSQNDIHKTTVCVYSLRAREHPTVSTPLEWDEVEHGLRKEDPSLVLFESEQVLERIEKHGDLFVEVLTLKQKLP
ncbi:MAG: non-homologous end-joining DNA ligase [Actinobacteria bacterium]|nr:non-homologous end-joining DNA ligase [Actinomycetota bacterium]MBU1945117.1 non-homologous end-joining DNA ligase [Actinomycetota bacterium]MBU2686432.1 non-homologous end-joining DNA ligase [Actinomycetota bacterium]